MIFASLALAVGAACTATPNPDDLEGATPDNGGSGVGPRVTRDGGRAADGAPLPPSDPGAGADTGGLPCEVSKILQTDCQTCHGATPSYGAPSALVTYADLTKTAAGGGKEYDAVKTRIHATVGAMPPSPSAPLAAADLQRFDAWIAAGAPPSTEACGSSPDAGPGVKPLSCTPDQFIRSPTKFTMPANTQDIYMCYGFDVTTTSKRHVVGFGPKIDNPKIVHHLLLFQTDASYGTTPQPCTASGSISWRLVSGWAPGGQNLETPPEAGFPEVGTTHWILQVHYNDASGKNVGQTDNSGYDLCTTDKLRPNDAAVMAPGTIKMTLPPRATTDITCEWNPLLLGKVHVFGATPHMHTLGTKMSTYVTRAGQKTKVVDPPSFDFNYQTYYPTSADIQDGDTVSTRCAWNNSTDQSVTWGENTGDEMCFDFLSYYPAVTSPLWSWTTPSMFASCSPTPP